MIGRDTGTGGAMRTATPVAEPIRIIPGTPWGRWVGAAVVAVFVAWVIYQILTNPGFQWRIVGKYMLHPGVLQGVAMTIELTALVMVAGTIIGIVIALMRLSDNPVLLMCAHAYLYFFRGTPVLVQLVFWYNLASLFPEISLGIPFGGPKFYSVSSTVAISSFVAAMLGLGLNEGAYMAERQQRPGGAGDAPGEDFLAFPRPHPG